MQENPLTTRLADRPSPATPSGLPGVGDLEWGSHLCQFYAARQDLVDTLVPWFIAGLKGRERCVWITAEPLTAREARKFLDEAMPGLDRLEQEGQIEIVDHGNWYMREGSLAADEVVATWLEREEAALRDGYAGLRVTGNLSFLAPTDRRSFEAYEERVNRSFRDRRIVALCSYPLADCGTDELLDVLRNHDRALLSHGGAVRPVHGATLLLGEMDHAGKASNGGSRASEATHAVHFYDDVLDTAEVVRFLEPALLGDEGVVLIATRDHRRRILAGLGSAGFEPDRLRERGQIVEIDAHHALATIAPDGEPSGPLLRQLVGDAFDRLSAHHGGIAVYGEIVDLLARRQRYRAATALERIWNELLGEYPVRLLCGYDLAAFDHDHGGGALGMICAEHSEIVGEARHPSGDPAYLHMALRQRTRFAREAMRQVTRLQNITAALAEASTIEHVQRVVSGVVTHALDAHHGSLSITAGEPSEDPATEDAGQTRIANPLLSPLTARLDGARQAWIGTRRALEHRFGEAAPPAIHALASLPLTVGGRPLGSVAFAFRKEQEFTLTDRALFEDVARQISIAVDRARLYRQAEEAREEAIRANRTKDEFLAMLGHELRNPLAPIVNALQVMELRADERTERERTVMNRQVGHLHRLVEDLLDISRITRGKLDIERDRVELSPVVARAVEATASRRDERRHELTVTVPPRGVAVQGDADRLAQVVGNLLDNAAKFTPPGGTIVLEAGAEGDEVVLRVRDSGIGMAPELAATVFDSFVQGSRSTAVHSGLGVGLAIVRGLVDAHGGSVSATSPGPGEGSEFIVRLPQAKAEAGDERAVQESGAAAVPRGVSVLIVDDNRDAADALYDLVDLFGGEPRLAHDGRAALVAAERARPDLVLLDIGLPGMSGHEVAARLRELPGGRTMRIVAVTGFGQQSDRERSLAAGCDEHWVKPLSPSVLESLIAELGNGNGNGNGDEHVETT